MIPKRQSFKYLKQKYSEYEFELMKLRKLSSSATVKEWRDHN